ncbi:MAG: iron ABC transporter [Cytophaga sp.]|nr:iron ABC transporter [Cytophaga sp.]
MKQVHFNKYLVALATSLLLLFILNISLGSVRIPVEELFKSLLTDNSSSATYSTIVWQFRLPKALTCILAGAALSVSGLLMQTLFRNPLAGPDVLGLSSGASLMVALVLLISQSASLLVIASNPWAIAIASSMGSSLVFILVIIISNYVKDNTSLLIIGLMISATTAAIVGVLQYVSRAEDLQAFMIWTMGNVGSTGWSEIIVLGIITLTGSGIALLFMKSLNGWLLGDHYAQSLGVNLKRSRFWIVTATSIMAGGVTAFCGPVAFVGLAVPHLIRLLIPTTNHKILLPAVMLGGPILLLFCDMLAQFPGSTLLLPLNAITSMIGAPVVIWMVIRNKKIRV